MKKFFSSLTVTFTCGTMERIMMCNLLLTGGFNFFFFKEVPFISEINFLVIDFLLLKI